MLVGLVIESCLLTCLVTEPLGLEESRCVDCGLRRRRAAVERVWGGQVDRSLKTKLASRSHDDEIIFRARDGRD